MAMSAEENRTVRQEIEAIREDLQGLAGEIRVKMHLAGMEAKDAWQELQPKLADYERRVESKSREVGRELEAIGRDLKSELEKLRRRIA